MLNWLTRIEVACRSQNINIKEGDGFKNGIKVATKQLLEPYLLKNVNNVNKVRTNDGRAECHIPQSIGKLYLASLTLPSGSYHLGLYLEQEITIFDQESGATEILARVDWTKNTFLEA